MLEREKLIGRRETGGKTIAQCPACAENGGDSKRAHLFIAENGAFGCIAHPGDHEHNRRIFALAGKSGEVPLRVSATVKTTPLVLKTGILGRLGRVFQTHAGSTRQESSNVTYTDNESVLAVPAVPSVEQQPTSKEPSQASQTLNNNADLEAACHRLFPGCEIFSDDGNDSDALDLPDDVGWTLRRRLAAADELVRGRPTKSQIETHRIGFARHAGSHPEIDAMLARLQEAKG